MENLRFFSSSSQSETLLPSSTLPRRSTALAWNNRASASEVFPAAPCPTSATLRMSSTLYLAMNGILFVYGTTRPANPEARPSRRAPRWRFGLAGGEGERGGEVELALVEGAA